MIRIRPFGVAIFLAVLSGACTDQADPAGPNPPQHSSVVSNPIRPPGLDGKFVEVAQRVPEFGGMFFDEAGALTINLTDVSQVRAAQQAIALVFADARISATSIRAQKSRYGFIALAKWHEQVRQVLALPGVTFTDIDEKRNRLVIGIESETLRPQVEAYFLDRRVPEEAFVIERRDALSFAATLQDRVRPAAGGLQIDKTSTSGGECTLGFNAWDWGANFEVVWFFITNSHCTLVQGGVEGTQLFQSTGGVSTDYLGYEVADPEYWTGGVCPEGKRCRYSDSARIQYNSNNDSKGSFIAFTYERSGSGPGSLLIADWMAIESLNPRPMIGQTMDKVGRTSGWTYGEVTQTCSNENVHDSDVHLLCQDIVSGYADYGDSGSPVFLYDPTPLHSGSAVGRANLYGILWGKGSGIFAMSPLEQIEQEVGQINH